MRPNMWELVHSRVRYWQDYGYTWRDVAYMWRRPDGTYYAWRSLAYTDGTFGNSSVTGDYWRVYRWFVENAPRANRWE